MFINIGGNPVFGGKGQANVETWRCVSTLRGHHGDVLDMAWSPHDTWLATCSIDNSVIVWNAAKFPGMCICLSSTCRHIFFVFPNILYRVGENFLP